MKPTVLLAVTGGVAAYKACDLARRLMDLGLRVRVVMSRNACAFVTPLTFRALTGLPVVTDIDDGGDPMPHITLAKEADLVVVAPATANIIAKMAHGAADDIVSTTLVAGNRPIIVAPAMNTQMWRHPAVTENVATLIARGVRIVGPATGELACGEVGEGKIAPIEEIVATVAATLDIRRDYAGVPIIVTAGGTREPLDAVRYIGNRSSGKMGVAVAVAAAARGARVTLIAANMETPVPDGVTVVRVGSAGEMEKALNERFDACRMVIMAAAVGDYRAAEAAVGKVKTKERWDIALTPNPDLIGGLGAKKRGRILVGFAAETDTPVEYGRAKLLRKNLDLIVVNDVSRSDIGFGADVNEVTLIGRSGEATPLPKQEKRRVADAILDAALPLLAPLSNEATA
jgi:phosphopantothenoylcysteine decarboxylase/phosphopantothenate--cysteine ligase